MMRLCAVSGHARQNRATAGKRDDTTRRRDLVRAAGCGPGPGRTPPGTCQGFMGCRRVGRERQDAGQHGKIVLRVVRTSPTSDIPLGLGVGRICKTAEPNEPPFFKPARTAVDHADVHEGRSRRSSDAGELRRSAASLQPLQSRNQYGATTHFVEQGTIFYANRQAGHRGSLLPCASRYGRGKKRRLMLVSLRYLDTFTNVDGSWLFAECQHYS